MAPTRSGNIKKGSFVIDGKEDKIYFEMESKYKYSEPGIRIKQGDLIIYTRKKGDSNIINVTRDYNNYNLTYSGREDVKNLQSSPSDYKLMISNEGFENEKVVIDFDLK